MTTPLHNHTALIIWLIRQRGFSSYLEIGVGDMKHHSAVACNHKVSVDPAEGQYVGAEPTHRMTSDEFFAQNELRFDLVFVDGLHHAGQVAQDMENALDCLADGGIIVVHDLLPKSEQMQEVPRVASEWTGDCWKAWVGLRQQRGDLQMFTVDADYGMGIIFPAGAKKTPCLDIRGLELTWENYQKHRDGWMNVVKPENVAAELGWKAHHSSDANEAKILSEDEHLSEGLTVVTLWRPGWSDAQHRVLAWMQAEPWPIGTHFAWSAAEGSETLGVLEEAVNAFTAGGGFSFELVEVPGPAAKSHTEKHQLVGALYTELIGQLQTKEVLFVEDDNVPEAGAWHAIRSRFSEKSGDTVAVMGAYRSRAACGKLCASKQGAYFDWSRTSEAESIEADWIGGGFTLYRTAEIQACLPVMPELRGNIQGWDVVLCRKLRQRNLRLYVEPSIRVEHACAEVLSWCEARGETVA